jgi:hypothetical protein
MCSELVVHVAVKSGTALRPVPRDTMFWRLLKALSLVLACLATVSALGKEKPPPAWLAVR